MAMTMVFLDPFASAGPAAGLDRQPGWLGHLEDAAGPLDPAGHREGGPLSTELFGGEQCNQTWEIAGKIISHGD